MTICPIYAFVGSSETNACRDAKNDLAVTFERFRSGWGENNRMLQLTQPLFLWCDFLGDRGLPSGQSDGVIQAGIPVYHDQWRSPESQIVVKIRGELMK